MTHRLAARSICRMVRRPVLLMVAMTCGIGLASAQGLPTITSGPNFGTFTIGEVQTAFTATGGSGNYTWSLVSGTLPTGLAIRSDVPSFFPAGATAGLIGIATTPGTYNFRISVTSGANSVQQNCTMKITGLTVKDAFSLPNAFSGVPYQYTLTALNGAGPLTWTATSALPPGLTFLNGVITGTPTTPGVTTVNYTVTDGIDTAFRSFQITVFTVRFLTVGLLPNATQGSTYNASVAATGGTGSFSYSLVSGGLPGGLSFNGSGAITGTVNAGPGRYGFSVTATDSASASYTKTFSIDVIGIPPNCPPSD